MYDGNRCQFITTGAPSKFHDWMLGFSSLAILSDTSFHTIRRIDLPVTQVDAVPSDGANASFSAQLGGLAVNAPLYVKACVVDTANVETCSPAQNWRTLAKGCLQCLPAGTRHCDGSLPQVCVCRDGFTGPLCDSCVLPQAVGDSPSSSNSARVCG